jgi:hypothetical protein
MDNLSKNWSQWHSFSKGKTVVKVEIDEHSIFENTITFKTHREYVEYLFKKKGYKVTQFGHKYSPRGDIEKWGLVFERADSEVRTLIFANGIVGVNIQPIEGML